MTRRPTQREIEALGVAIRKAYADHDAALLLSVGSVQIPDPPLVQVPEDVFGRSEISISEAEAAKALWDMSPPKAPPAWAGLKPRRSRR